MLSLSFSTGMNTYPIKEIFYPSSINLHVVLRPSLVGAPNPIMSQFDSVGCFLRTIVLSMSGFPRFNVHAHYTEVASTDNTVLMPHGRK